MRNAVTISNDFLVPEIEAHITQLASELDGYATLQGKQDGQKEQDITEPAYQVKIVRYIQGKGQEVMNFIKSKTLIASEIVNVRQLEQAGKVTSEKKRLEINEKKHQVLELRRIQKTITPDPFKRAYRPWLWPLAIVVAVADALLAYKAFRGGSYTTVNALVTSLAIALVIAIGHLLYTPWIMREAGWKHIVRIVTALVAGFIFFFLISTLRVASINSAVSIAIPTHATAYMPPHISKWSVCGISFILFSAVLFFSLVVWMPKEERLQFEQYKKVTAEIGKEQSEITALDNEINEIGRTISVAQTRTRKLYEYVRTSFKRIKDIGSSAKYSYQRKYADFHATVPSFFPDDSEIEYDESFEFVQPEKHPA
jgi:hypothetical protein